VQVGLALPIEANVVAFAQHAERLGFAYLGASEHIAFRAPVPNSFIWLSVAAGATQSIGLVSTVALLPLYPAVLFAKMVVSLDYLSGGRFNVGIGVGGEYPEEFRAAGVPISERGDRADEALEVLKALSQASRPTSFAGRWTAFDGLCIAPKRDQSRPSIWVGGRHLPAMRRAARYADMWMPYMVTPDETARGRSSVQQLARECDRQADQITTGVYLFTVVSDDEARARQQAVEFTSWRYKQDFRPLAHKFLLGPPDKVIARMSEYVAAGATTFILELTCPQAEYSEQMERIAHEIVPYVTGARK
jgi:alkanesulfonate monooxygenase SsuD/methylene tetrahydromethanopterin reductase-like flavin-dependent oxidoreductase (luciferase family)